jgi:hypothetical protein
VQEHHRQATATLRQTVLAAQHSMTIRERVSA